MERLNQAVPPGNDDQVTTANASATAGTPHGQSPTGNATITSVDSGATLDDAERDRVVQAVAKNLLAHYSDH
jgi:hypothetical protein